MIYSIHRLDPANLGDQVCGALQCAGITLDKVLDIEASHVIRTDDVIVYGGGGLLHGQWLEWMHQMAHRRHRPALIAP